MTLKLIPAAVGHRNRGNGLINRYGDRSYGTSDASIILFISIDRQVILVFNKIHGLQLRSPMTRRPAYNSSGTVRICHHLSAHLS
jgi:hypothetical protein